MYGEGTQQDTCAVSILKVVNEEREDASRRYGDDAVSLDVSIRVGVPRHHCCLICSLRVVILLKSGIYGTGGNRGVPPSRKMAERAKFEYASLAAFVSVSVANKTTYVSPSLFGNRSQLRLCEETPFTVREMLAQRGFLRRWNGLRVALPQAPSQRRLRVVHIGLLDPSFGDK